MLSIGRIPRPRRLEGCFRPGRFLLAVIVVSALGLLLPASQAWAQTPSTLDTMRIVSVTNAHPGDTISVDLYLRNVDTLGAFTFRVVFDASVIGPLTDTTINGVDTTINVEAFQQLRGTAFETFGASLPATGVLTFGAVDFDQNPSSLFFPGAGAEVRMKWRVKSTASAQTATIQFQNDPVYSQSFNTFSDFRGSIFKRPVLTNGTVTITTGGNNPPAITNCPSPTSVTAGQLVQFTVTATDPDGNNLSLLASNLPTGSSFSPSNPVTGTATVNGTFSWVPGVSQLGNFTVSFRATDSPGGLTSSFCNVTITVSQATGNVAPVVICPSSNSYTVDQGQEVQFAISASDINNDPIQLYPVNAPTGSTLLPSNPALGTGSVSATFKWTPTFSQSGIFSVGFQAKDTANNLSSICNVTITVNQVQVDRLFSTSAAGQSPQGGVAGTHNVVIPVNFLNVKKSYGVQFDFVYDPAIFTPTAIQTSDRLTGFTVYENLGTNPGRIRVVTFSLTGASVAAGTSSVLFNIVGNINAGVTPGAYDIKFENAWGSVDPDPSKPSASLSTTDGVIMVDNLGDVNLDTRVDVADVVAVVGYILGTFTFDSRQFGAANINGDNLVDVFDLVGIIDLIFGAPMGSAPGKPPTGGTPALVQFQFDKNYGAYGAYRLSAELPSDVAGAQIELAYDPAKVSLGSPEVMDAASNLQLHYNDNGQGRLRALLIYDPRNASSRILSGHSDVLRVPLASAPLGDVPSVRLEEIKLAAPDASQIEVSGYGSVPRNFELDQNYPNPFNPSTTIEFSLGEQSGGSPVDVRLDVYNILGQRVKTLVQGTLGPGRYTYVWDGTDQSNQQVASGLYLYRLMAGDRSETKKMVLMK